MLDFSAKVVECSACDEHDITLYTLSLVYPRFIHSELMTHRMFSRNAMSSRAVPVEKMLAQVRHNPAMPIHWGKNQPGMQAHHEHDELVYLPDWDGGPGMATPEQAWRVAAEKAADVAEAMMKAGYHKQVANRLLEPFQWMRTLVTATDWSNFWSLRCHPDAEPNMQRLAYLMREAVESATPRMLRLGQWHLPFVSDDERAQYSQEVCRKLSTARCARVSFLNHDGTNPDPVKDMDLHDKLVVAKPIHASPAEHQAMPLVVPLYDRNFRGWKQYRAFLEEHPA